MAKTRRPSKATDTKKGKPKRVKQTKHGRERERQLRKLAKEKGVSLKVVEDEYIFCAEGIEKMDLGNETAVLDCLIEIIRKRLDLNDKPEEGNS